MEEIDLKELFEMFWNKKIAISIIVMLFIGLGCIYTGFFVIPEYISSTTLVLTKVNNSTQQQQQQVQSDTTDSITTTDVYLNSQLVSTYSELVKSKKVLRTVISNLQADINEGQLRNNVTVSSVKDTELIRIDVKNTNPVLASKIANEIAKVFTENVSEIYSINNVHIVDQAEPSSSPSNVNHVKDLVIFIFIGFVVASLYVILVNMFDTTVKSTEDIEKILKLPVLVSIPYYEYAPTSNKGGKK